MIAVRLPTPDGGVVAHRLSPPATWRPLDAPSTSRTVYAAAHVVADPRADGIAGGPSSLDWDATLRFRHHLWDLGLGVADAMDTAQRNQGLTWTAAAELIRRTGADAAARGAPLVVGVGTDQLGDRAGSLEEVVTAYADQLAVAESAGATPVLMASRQLARIAEGPEDYAEVYGTVIGRASGPVVLHWLGTAFDPHLAGYWGSAQDDVAAEHVLALIDSHRDRIDGVKVSLLDAELEVRLRRRMPPGVRTYCGDDFHYPELIAGDAEGHSHALLGIFDAIAPAASTALRALDEGDAATFRDVLDPTVGLSRHLFTAPTSSYKTGITFLAWLAGHQDAFVMVGGQTASRAPMHLVEAFRIADSLGLFPDPELTASRLQTYLHLTGLA